MTDTVQAYCMKCREHRQMSKPQAVYTRTGTPATKGTCPECGTNLFRMGETDAHANVPKPDKIEKPARKKKAKTTKKRSNSRKKKKASTRRSTGKVVIVESPAKARSVANFLDATTPFVHLKAMCAICW